MQEMQSVLVLPFCLPGCSTTEAVQLTTLLTTEAGGRQCAQGAGQVQQRHSRPQKEAAAPPLRTPQPEQKSGDPQTNGTEAASRQSRQ